MNIYIAIRVLMFSILLLLTNTTFAQATDEYSLSALRGIQTIWFKFTERGDKKCSYQHELREKALPLLSELKQLGLEVRDEIPTVGNVPPDLAVLVSVEATASNDVGQESVCAIFIKLEAIHSMTGTLRYQTSPIVLRVPAYRTLQYGIAPREKVGIRLQEAALHAIAVFANAYLLANPR
jgi:hypothetical protein